MLTLNLYGPCGATICSNGTGKVQTIDVQELLVRKL
jgi:hypothetical protein